MLGVVPKKTAIWAKAIGQGHPFTLDTCLVFFFSFFLFAPRYLYVLSGIILEQKYQKTSFEYPIYLALMLFFRISERKLLDL